MIANVECIERKEISNGEYLVFVKLSEQTFFKKNHDYYYYATFVGGNIVDCININTKKSSPERHDRIIENHFFIEAAEEEFAKLIKRKSENNVIEMGGKNYAE